MAVMARRFERGEGKRCVRHERGERKRCVRPAFKPVAVPTQVELAPQNADAKLKYRE